MQLGGIDKASTLAAQAAEEASAANEQEQDLNPPWPYFVAAFNFAFFGLAPQPGTPPLQTATPS